MLGIRTWASLLAISDTSYSQTMTMLLATSPDATHGVHFNCDDLLKMVFEIMVVLTDKECSTFVRKKMIKSSKIRYQWSPL